MQPRPWVTPWCTVMPSTAFSLPWVMVAAQIGATQVDLPQFAPNLSYFDPKILARQRGLS